VNQPLLLATSAMNPSLSYAAIVIVPPPGAVPLA
jgi:hypothetical protein